MNALKALLGTIGIFAVATFLTWLATRGTWVLLRSLLWFL